MHENPVHPTYSSPILAVFVVDDMAACLCRTSKVMKIPCFFCRFQKRDKCDVPGWRLESRRLAFFLPAQVRWIVGDYGGRSCSGFAPIASNFPLPQLTAPPADRLRDTVVLVPVQSPRFSKELAYPCLYCCLYSSNFLPLPLFAPLNPSFREFCRNDVGREAPCSTSLWVNEPGRRETQEVRR